MLKSDKRREKGSCPHQVEGASTGHLDDVGEALDADGHVLLLLDVLQGIRGCKNGCERYAKVVMREKSEQRSWW